MHRFDFDIMPSHLLLLSLALMRGLQGFAVVKWISINDSMDSLWNTRADKSMNILAELTIFHPIAYKGKIKYYVE